MLTGADDLVAIASVAMLNPKTYWAPQLADLSVALELAAANYSILGRRASRSYAAGFALANRFLLDHRIGTYSLRNR